MFINLGLTFWTSPNRLALTKVDGLTIVHVAIAKIKATAFAGEEPKTSCPSCGAQVTLNSKFCGECGGKMPVHEPEPVEEEAAPLTETIDETKAETAEVVDTPAEAEAAETEKTETKA